MKPLEQVYGKLSAKVLAPASKPSRALVLLHGMGSNEENLLELGQMLTNDRLVISLRAPIRTGRIAFAWFQVDSSNQDRTTSHNWPEASSALLEVETALLDIHVKTGVPLNKISLYGFSQGAILTIGLALTSKLQLENYIAASGRTLPEFATAASLKLPVGFKDRKIFVTHGVSDNVLPVELGKATETTLRSLGAQLVYQEYAAPHSVSREMVDDAKQWLASP